MRTDDDELVGAVRKPEEQAEGPWPFGPTFFLGQLRAFARGQCPDPSEHLPAVTVHLATGEALDLCHVAGLAPTFVALAIREHVTSSGKMLMRTELVPYALITRITIRPVVDAKHMGFDSEHAPTVVSGGIATPEDVLRCAAASPETP